MLIGHIINTIHCSGIVVIPLFIAIIVVVDTSGGGQHVVVAR